MVVRVQKWGNSLALRIPKSFAAETGLSPGVEVRLSLLDGKLLMEPVKTVTYGLKQLLSQVNEANLHGEYIFDPPAGDERL